MKNKVILFTIALLLFATTAFCGSSTKDLSAENTFTSTITPLQQADWRLIPSILTVSISGTWSGTITIQRQFPDVRQWNSYSKVRMELAFCNPAIYCQNFYQQTLG